MKKRCNIIQINGFSGLILVAFIICCAAAGFIVFPSWCCMNLWNLMASAVNFPPMNIFHGGLLWVVVVLTFFVTHIDNKPIKFSSFTTVEKDDLKNTLDMFQAKDMNKIIAEEKETEETNNITKEN